jgi:hypothetical protein
MYTLGMLEFNRFVPINVQATGLRAIPGGGDELLYGSLLPFSRESTRREVSERSEVREKVWCTGLEGEVGIVHDGSETTHGSHLLLHLCKLVWLK